MEGYAKAEKMNIPLTDDMHAIELLCKKIVLIDPGYPNPKMGTSYDLKYLLPHLIMNKPPIRIGHGFDLHILADNRKLILEELIFF